MRTRRITSPSLAQLWQHLLATLEGQEAENAPALARSLAISGLVGQPARAFGVSIEREGEVYLIHSPEPVALHARPAGRRRRCVLAGR